MFPRCPRTWHPALAGLSGTAVFSPSTRYRGAEIVNGVEKALPIGSSLDAEVDIAIASEAEARVLAAHAADLEEVFIVSAVRVLPARKMGETAEAPEGFRVEARPAAGTKCGRCWRYRTNIGMIPDHPGLCAECVEIVSYRGEKDG